MSTSRLEQLRTVINQCQTSQPPSPWELAGEWTVASLYDIGFDRDSELLLVSSSSGLGLFDCETGKKIARDTSDRALTDRFLECKGIGALENKTIHMAGVYGGSLPSTTSDGWTTETVTLKWPEHHLLLLKPGAWLHGAECNQPSSFHKLAIEYDMRAFGFSYTGQTLVIATSGDVVIYKRHR
ncbi:hypothetical protein [Pseudomonas fluorescens]|uniref:Uncharacterized protein n=1 Tax=Pseudomonas fluorescens TaxID=294 RepID=A0A0F4TI00_PSEFL|nr:hypothetical protein [Pseudomonas fluorescens]KJZ44048.1 hypothetical protein VC34_12760 [Pseudomonas fluorescens]